MRYRVGFLLGRCLFRFLVLLVGYKSPLWGLYFSFYFNKKLLDTVQKKKRSESEIISYSSSINKKRRIFKQEMRTNEGCKLTCNGNWTNAGSNRFLQYLWNQMVNTGRTISNGVE